ncbi:MAG: hypothetical protein ACR2FI_08560 [Burkholderiales bacterium]
MKSISMLGTAVIFGASLFGASVTVSAQEATASATLKTINGSGIRGAIFFDDSGDGLSFSGVARGMDPSKTYVSLVYDEGSKPGGTKACLPSDGSLTFEQMVLGFWTVDQNGVGVLPEGTKTGAAYASLDQIGTTSIRLDTGQRPNETPPQRFVLQACGKVK